MKTTLLILLAPISLASPGLVEKATVVVRSGGVGFAVPASDLDFFG
ncbi:MAG: hypothetical protein ACOC2N_05600 [Spirochaetota bacterium]